MNDRAAELQEFVERSRAADKAARGTIDSAMILRDARTYILASKVDLRHWLEPRRQYGRAHAAWALLETALEMFIDELGERETQEIAKSAIAKLTIDHSHNA